MSFNKKQLDADAKFAKKQVNKPQYVIPVSKSIATPNVKKMGGSIKKTGGFNSGFGGGRFSGSGSKGGW